MKAKLPLIPTIFTISALIILLVLGSWQVKRLLWKNQLVTQTESRMAMPAIPLPYGKPDIDSLKYRKFIVSGHFLHDKEVHLFTGAKVMRGKPGYNIFTPLVRDNGSAVLVDRGWVPASKKERSKRPETLVEGEVSLVGMLHEGEHKATFTPENDIEKNLWFWIDIPTIAGFSGNDMDNVYVRALLDKSAENSLPVAGESKIEVRNDHLQYAIIWYSFAIILLIIYTIYVRRQASDVRIQKENT
jgi:surfeit locus 1 family protein